MRIIELPLALCPNGEPALAVLVNRTDALTLGYTVWLSDNYDPTGEEPAESYNELDRHNRFSRLGTLQESYGTETKTIDRDFGVLVQLTGADRTIDPQSMGKAMANELLVFIDDEIMSVVDVALVAAGKYRLQVIRNRFASARAGHAVGASVWILERAELQALQHPSFVAGNTIALKMALRFGRFAQDLSEVDAETHTIANRILAEPALDDLRFNGSARYLNWDGGDVTFSWTLTDAGARFVAQDLAAISTRIDFIANPPDPVFTAVEDYDLIGTQTVAEDSLELTEAELLALVGADPFFIVVRRQILTPEFATLSSPITLYITQD